jgi:hypothetical protein
MGYTKFSCNGLHVSKWDEPFGMNNGHYEIYIKEDESGDCWANLTKEDIKELIKFLKKVNKDTKG